MSNYTAEEDVELKVLRDEFRWLLNKEVPSMLGQIHTLLLECARRYPLRLQDAENIVKPEKFLLTSPNADSIKCVATLLGDNIHQADIVLKVFKHQSQIHKTHILPDAPWKLQQIQDAGNHLYEAIDKLQARGDRDRSFTSGAEVIQLLSEISACLVRGRCALVMPKKKTIDELMNSPNMSVVQPPVPNDTAISFYIQSHKLVFAVYHLHSQHGPPKFDVYQGECSVPWLNESLMLFTVALQLCQQLKDKVSVFSQYHIPDAI